LGDQLPRISVPNIYISLVQHKIGVKNILFHDLFKGHFIAYAYHLQYTTSQYITYLEYRCVILLIHKSLVLEETVITN